VTSPPDLSGLPFWAQLLITFMTGVGALYVMVRGYFPKKGSAPISSGDSHTAAVMAATIADMGAIRHLSDVCIKLTGAVERQTNQLSDNEHEAKNSNDLGREICARLRENREVMERLERVLERKIGL
jgi:hypothetical protein